MFYCHHFLGQTIYYYTYTVYTMAGVVERMWWLGRHREEVARRIVLRGRLSPTVLELEAAKEILSEIFGAKPRDVEEMIEQRLAEQRFP
jgi:hypothetical protein